jgi:hypothetical protein
MESAGRDKKKSVLKTIRISESLARSLEKEAADEGTTVNADVSKILSRYFDWDKRMSEFGFVTVSKAAFKRMIGELSDETLSTIAREAVPDMFGELAELWFQSSSPEKVLEAITMRYRFDSVMHTEITTEGNEYTVVVHHDLGPKWSIYVESVIKEVVRRWFHAEPRMSRGESVVTARYRFKPRNPSS